MMLTGCMIAMAGACAQDFSPIYSAVETVELARDGRAPYPKPNRELERRFGAIKSYAIADIGNPNKEDLDKMAFGKDQLERLFKMMYAFGRFDDWACSEQGDVVIFVSRKSGDLHSSIYEVFKENGGAYKWQGSYMMTSRYLQDAPEKLAIEPDGILVTFAHEYGNRKEGVERVSVSKKFFFKKKREIFRFLTEHEEGIRYGL